MQIYLLKRQLKNEVVKIARFIKPYEKASVRAIKRMWNPRMIYDVEQIQQGS